MYCAGVLTFDGGFMDSSSSRTKCVTERCEYRVSPSRAQARRLLMNKYRIRCLRQRASGPETAKPISIKSAGGKSGGCARKAVEFTSGDLRRVTEL
jgi:hypothetical protein